MKPVTQPLKFITTQVLDIVIFKSRLRKVIRRSLAALSMQAVQVHTRIEKQQE